MKPKSRGPEQDDLLRPRLTDMIDMRHELVKLAALIDWEFFEAELCQGGCLISCETGRQCSNTWLAK